jgi:hypothetical protein
MSNLLLPAAAVFVFLSAIVWMLALIHAFN